MSRVEVDKIQQQCGSTLTVGGGAGKTVTVDSTTVTIGRCGGTVSLASGATQSGFGSSGPVVDWQTSSIKTGDFTAVSGEGYFVNTTAGSVTCTLPSGPSAGDYCGFIDYARTWDTNYCYLGRNSSKIQGATEDWVGYENGQQVTLLYVDGTQGWLPISENLQSSENVDPFVAATGGTITTSGNYKIHTFTGPGTFSVTKLATSAPNSAADYVVVAGGGGGGVGEASPGGNRRGGGGAGGYRESPGSATGCYTVSPRGAAPATGITVTATGYPITVGSGGSIAPPNGPGGNGSDSTFSTITGTGGGGGAQFNLPVPCGGGPKSGGSGGGGGGRSGCVGSSGGAASPVTNPVQGTAGGPATPGTSPGSIDAGGGGGGALCAGAAGAPNGPGGVGGAGGISSINGTPTARAGGGGAGSEVGAGGAGGNGGGGAGVSGTGTGTSGTVNTGGGGGGKGTGTPGTSGTGGSGIIILRYKFQ